MPDLDRRPTGKGPKSAGANDAPRYNSDEKTRLANLLQNPK